MNNHMDITEALATDVLEHCSLFVPHNNHMASKGNAILDTIPSGVIQDHLQTHVTTPWGMQP